MYSLRQAAPATVHACIARFIDAWDAPQSGVARRHQGTMSQSPVRQ